MREFGDVQIPPGTNASFLTIQALVGVMVHFLKNGDSLWLKCRERLHHSENVSP